MSCRLLFIFGVLCIFIQCRYNDFQSTDIVGVRQHAKISICLESDEDNRKIEIETLPGVLHVPKEGNKDAWKKNINILFPEKDYKDGIKKINSVQFSFKDSNSKIYSADLFYEVKLRLISSNLSYIKQYKIVDLICNCKSHQISNTDWLNSSTTDPDAKIYI